MTGLMTSQANAEIAKIREQQQLEAFSSHVVASTAVQVVVSNEKDADRRVDVSEFVKERHVDRETVPSQVRVPFFSCDLLVFEPFACSFRGWTQHRC
jgi:arginine decarboxylase-like protein